MPPVLVAPVRVPGVFPSYILSLHAHSLTL